MVMGGEEFNCSCGTLLLEGTMWENWIVKCPKCSWVHDRHPETLRILASFAKIAKGEF